MCQPDDPPDTAPSLEAWIITTRLLQGLPPHVEDLVVLLRIVELLDLTDGQDEQ